MRGDFEQDPFVRMVLDHIKEKTALANDMLRRLGVEHEEIEMFAGKRDKIA